MVAVRSGSAGWFHDHCQGRPDSERAKFIARMTELASHGNWNSRVPFVKQLKLSDSLAKHGITVLEIKSHQDRILFVRDGNDAVIVHAMVKKDDWSKRDERQLEKAVSEAQAYFAGKAHRHGK
jgi:hypothetical protein